MTNHDHALDRAPVAGDDLQVIDREAPDGGGVDHGACCVVCGDGMEEPGCCSFDCVREARRQLDHNVLQLRRLQHGDGPTETRQRLVDRNGRLTAALMAWNR